MTKASSYELLSIICDYESCFKDQEENPDDADDSAETFTPRWSVFTCKNTDKGTRTKAQGIFPVDRLKDGMFFTAELDGRCAKRDKDCLYFKNIRMKEHEDEMLRQLLTVSAKRANPPGELASTVAELAPKDHSHAIFDTLDKILRRVRKGKKVPPSSVLISNWPQSDDLHSAVLALFEQVREKLLLYRKFRFGLDELLGLDATVDSVQANPYSIVDHTFKKLCMADRAAVIVDRDNGTEVWKSTCATRLESVAHVALLSLANGCQLPDEKYTDPRMSLSKGVWYTFKEVADVVDKMADLAMGVPLQTEMRTAMQASSKVSVCEDDSLYAAVSLAKQEEAIGVQIGKMVHIGDSSTGEACRAREIAARFDDLIDNKDDIEEATRLKARLKADFGKWEWVFEAYKKTDPVQRSVVFRLLDHNVVLLTGPPGTGKTTTTALCYGFLHLLGIRMQALAPTGQAVRRVTECISTVVSCHSDSDNYPRTVHSESARTASKPASAYIIDEASMVDQQILSKLFCTRFSQGAYSSGRFLAHQVLSLWAMMNERQ
jgi:hypothetical protein